MALIFENTDSPNPEDWIITSPQGFEFPHAIVCNGIIMERELSFYYRHREYIGKGRIADYYTKGGKGNYNYISYDENGKIISHRTEATEIPQCESSLTSLIFYNKAIYFSENKSLAKLSIETANNLREITNDFKDRFSQIQNNKREQDIAADQIKLLSDTLEKNTIQMFVVFNRLEQMENKFSTLCNAICEKAHEYCNECLGTINNAVDSEL